MNGLISRHGGNKVDNSGALRTIKEVFDDECQDLKIDQQFFKKVCELEARFVCKNQDSLEFFGGNLIGVQRVRFTADDRDRLFTDILEADDHILQERVYALRSSSGIPVINQDFIISSDIFNISVIWLLHAVHRSPHLDAERKQEAKVRLALYLIYKFTTSWLTHSFRYPADPEIAAAAYDQLSLKFILKQTGSWGAALRVFATNAVDPNGIHGKTIERLDYDTEHLSVNPVTNMLNDMKGRINDMLKNLYGVLVRTKEQGKRVKLSSSFVETDGELVFKDQTKSLGNYTRYLKSIVSDKNTFIRQELVEVVAKTMHTMPERLLLNTLGWMSDNYARTTDGIVEEVINSTMEHAFEYLSANRSALHNKADLAGLLVKLRGTYTSSRATEKSLLDARALVESLVRTATKTKNDSVIAATRTGVMLYIVLRAYCMHHYANR